MDRYNDILLLLYEDNLVFLGDFPIDIARKLRTLQNYCTSNKLLLNTTTTKTFSKGGYNDNYYKNKCSVGVVSIEVVETYTNLEVTFSVSGMLLEMATRTVAKAYQAMGAVMDLMSKSKMCSCNTRIDFDTSISLSSLA
ncbi:hypothetical protein JTB14_030692 [Gonioctena quinquepunctata]|nr:hypothetical protein JTB14_030692 [Gonioctena quinquepunctata]